MKNEYMEMNLDSVPINETLGGQSFANAFAQLYQQLIFNGVSAASVTAQPFLRKRSGRREFRFLQGLFQLHCRGGRQLRFAHQGNRRIRSLEKMDARTVGSCPGPRTARPYNAERPRQPL